MTAAQQELVNFYHSKQWVNIIKQNRLLSEDALLYLSIHFWSLIDKIECEDDD